MLGSALYFLQSNLSTGRRDGDTRPFDRRYMGLASADRDDLAEPRAAFEAHVQRLLQVRASLLPSPALVCGRGRECVLRCRRCASM